MLVQKSILTKLVIDSNVGVYRDSFAKHVQSD